MVTEAQKIQMALNLAVKYGGNDGAHHLRWVIDQMVRALTDCPEGGESQAYRNLVANACDGEDGPDTYSWDVGIPP